ncbi:PD-(D/E)XK nuclease family protein [Streptomyces sp. p1417]|uniref:PD-(D/E)XK nuclease family protein n=1 Tax=Streptomyces typhae TaxID=2681492 RepID=A0A6L6X151_9ACTN|nr:PD-(D/E)XK nuclease family protein [Streptomyces typhae]MVO87410.1 PD-(D/E)XK nuclease family protein [Streptomyces typhae]
MSADDQPRSVSQTEQYEQCAWRWYLSRIERVKKRPAAWSCHGTAFHTAAEAWERSSRTLRVDEVAEIFRDQYTELVNSALEEEPDTNRWLAAGRYSGGEDIERRYSLGLEQTRAYVEWSKAARPDIWTTPADEPGLELSFMVELGGVMVRGFIDQVLDEGNGSVRVRDLKTGSMKSKFQLQTYSVAVRKLWGLPVDKADWYLARDGRLSRPVKVGTVTEEEIGQRYADMDAGVKRGDFPAAPGFSCQFCDVSHRCIFSSQKT